MYLKLHQQHDSCCLRDIFSSNSLAFSLWCGTLTSNKTWKMTAYSFKLWFQTSLWMSTLYVLNHTDSINTKSHTQHEDDFEYASGPQNKCFIFDLIISGGYFQRHAHSFSCIWNWMTFFHLTASLWGISTKNAVKISDLWLQKDQTLLDPTGTTTLSEVKNTLGGVLCYFSTPFIHFSHWTPLWIVRALCQ